MAAGGTRSVFLKTSSELESRRGSGRREGVRKSSSCIDISFCECIELGVATFGELPLVGERDLARSAQLFLSFNTYSSIRLPQSLLPSLRFCLSFRPFNISSSNFLVLSSSSLSRWSPSSLIRSKKSLTSSEVSISAMMNIRKFVSSTRIENW